MTFCQCLSCCCLAPQGIPEVTPESCFKAGRDSHAAPALGLPGLAPCLFFPVLSEVRAHTSLILPRCFCGVCAL